MCTLQIPLLNDISNQQQNLLYKSWNFYLINQDKKSKRVHSGGNENKLSWKKYIYVNFVGIDFLTNY